MTREIPHDLDVDYELTRFVRRVRTRGMSRLGEIHPQLDYGTFLFLLAICDATDGVRGSELAEQLGVARLFDCDVGDMASLDRTFADLAKDWPTS